LEFTAASYFSAGRWSLVSEGHFKVLREAGLIRQRDEGTRRLNRLRRDDATDPLQPPAH
jgi:hypothetical protein